MVSSNCPAGTNLPAVIPVPVEAPQKVSVIYRAIDELRPDPKNPRLHTPKQVRQIANSIREFGFVGPIVIDRRGIIVAGHGRYLAARLLGVSEVPTISLDYLTPAQLRAFQIADNELHRKLFLRRRSILAEAFQRAVVEVLDFSLDITGFELPEIDLHILSLDAVRGVFRRRGRQCAADCGVAGRSWARFGELVSTGCYVVVPSTRRLTLICFKASWRISSSLTRPTTCPSKAMCLVTVLFSIASSPWRRERCRKVNSPLSWMQFLRS